MAANVFRFEESWSLPGARVEEVYDVLSRGELLPHWWKDVYLEAERLSADRLKVRARGFLPYEMNFVVEARSLERDRRIEATTTGDLAGRWSASLRHCDGGTRVDLVWEVTVLQPILRALAPLLRPAFAWNHRWTTVRGERGLRAFLAHRKGEEQMAC